MIIIIFLKAAVSGERFPRSFQAERSPVASSAGAPAQHPELPPPLKARAVTPFQGFSKASPQTSLSIPQDPLGDAVLNRYVLLRTLR